MNHQGSLAVTIAAAAAAMVLASERVMLRSVGQINKGIANILHAQTETMHAVNHIRKQIGNLLPHLPHSPHLRHECELPEF